MLFAPRRVRAACTAVSLALLVLASLADASPGDSDATPEAAVCAVEIEQLPVVLLDGGDYELLVPGQPARPLPRTGVARVAICAPVVVRLDGPAYVGAVSLTPADCDGDQVHTIAATPKPARLLFQAGAVLPSELVVSCVSGCPHRLRTADRFPLLPIPDDTLERVVELEFKARGHRSQTVEYKLSPGDNPIRVSLRPLDD